MSLDIKTLASQLEAARDDPCLQNLIFRYYQGLELGDSHWRESLHLEKAQTTGKSFEELAENYPQSKQSAEESRLINSHPKGADVNLIMLQKKYGHGRDC